MILMNGKKEKWQERVEKLKTRDVKFITTSSEPVELLGTPE